MLGMMKITSRVEPMASPQLIDEIDQLIEKYGDENPIIRCLRLMRPYLNSELEYRIPEQPGVDSYPSVHENASKSFLYASSFEAQVIENLPLLPVQYVQSLFAFSIENISAGMVQQPLRVRVFMLKEAELGEHTCSAPISDEVFYDFVPENFANIEASNKPACYFCKLEDIIKTKLIVIVERYSFARQKESYEFSQFPALYERLLVHSNEQITTPQYIGAFSLLDLFKSNCKARFSSLFETSEFSVQPYDTYINMLTQFYLYPRGFRGSVTSLIANTKKLKPAKGVSVYLNCAFLNYGRKSGDGIVLYRHVYPKAYINHNFEEFTATANELTDETVIKTMATERKERELDIQPNFVLKSRYKEFRLIQTYETNSQQFDCDIYDAQFSNNMTLHSFQIYGVRTRDLVFIKVQLLSDEIAPQFFIYGNNEKSNSFVSAGIRSSGGFFFPDQVKINYPLVLPEDNQLSINFSVHSISSSGDVTQLLFSCTVRVNEELLQSDSETHYSEKQAFRYSIMQNSLFYPNVAKDEEMLATVYSLFKTDGVDDASGGYASLIAECRVSSFYLRQNLFFLLLIVFAEARFSALSNYEYIRSSMLLEAMIDQIAFDKDPEADLIDISRFYVEQLLKCSCQPRYYELCGQWFDASEHCYFNNKVTNNSVRYEYMDFLFCQNTGYVESVSMDGLLSHAEFMICGFESAEQLENFDLLDTIKRKRLQSVLIAVLLLQMYYTLIHLGFSAEWRATPAMRQLIAYMVFLSNDEQQFANFGSLSRHLGYVTAVYLFQSHDRDALDEIVSFGRNMQIKFISNFALYTAQFYCKICSETQRFDESILLSVSLLFERIFQQLMTANNQFNFTQDLFNCYTRFITVVFAADLEFNGSSAISKINRSMYDVLTISLLEIEKSDDVERARAVSVLAMCYLHEKYGEMFVEMDVANDNAHLRFIILFSNNFFSRTKEEQFRYFQERNNNKRKQYIDVSRSNSKLAITQLSSVFKNRMCYKTLERQLRTETTSEFIKTSDEDLEEEVNEARIIKFFNLLISEVLGSQNAYIHHLSPENFWMHDNLAHLATIVKLIESISGLDYLYTNNCCLCRKILTRIVRMLINIWFESHQPAIVAWCDANLGIFMECFFRLLRYINIDQSAGELLYYLAVFESVECLTQPCVIIERHVYEFVLESKNVMLINYMRFSLRKLQLDQRYSEESIAFKQECTSKLEGANERIKLDDELMFVSDGCVSLVRDIIELCDAVLELLGQKNSASAISSTTHVSAARSCGCILRLFPFYLEMKYDVIELLELLIQPTHNVPVSQPGDRTPLDVLHAIHLGKQHKSTENLVAVAITNLFSAYLIVQGLQLQEDTQLLEALLPDSAQICNGHFLTLLHDDFLGRMLREFPFTEAFSVRIKWPYAAVISQKLSLANLDAHLCEAQRIFSYFGTQTVVKKIIGLRAMLLMQTQGEEGLKQAYNALVLSNAVTTETEAIANRLKMRENFVLAEKTVFCRFQMTEQQVFAQCSFQQLFYMENKPDNEIDVFSLSFLRNLERYSKNDSDYLWYSYVEFVCKFQLEAAAERLRFRGIASEEVQSCFFRFVYKGRRLLLVVYRIESVLPNLKFKAPVCQCDEFEVSQLVLVYVHLLAVHEDLSEALKQFELILEVLGAIDMKNTSATLFKQEALNIMPVNETSSTIQEQISNCSRVQPLCPESPTETNRIRQFSSSKENINAFESVPAIMPGGGPIFSEETIEIDPEDLQFSSGAKYSQDSSKIFTDQVQQQAQRKSKTEYLGNQIQSSEMLVQSSLKIPIKFETTQTLDFQFTDKAVRADELQLCKLLSQLMDCINERLANKNNETAQHLGEKVGKALQTTFKNLQNATNNDRWQQLHEELTRENSFNEDIGLEDNDTDYLAREDFDGLRPRSSMVENDVGLISVSTGSSESESQDALSLQPNSFKGDK